LSPRDRRRLRRVHELEEFATAAGRLLPRSVRAYVEGGSGSGSTVIANRQAFDGMRFIPRFLRDVSSRDQSVTLFGRTYASPFGIAPMGASAVVAYDADNRMARAARTAGIPYTLSANSITPMEEVIGHNPDAWFAAYLPTDTQVIEGMVARIGRAGFKVLVVTVDVPMTSNRPTERRAGYTMPLRPRADVVLDVLAHPRWLGGALGRTLVRRGLPVISNIRPRGGPHIFSRKPAGIAGASGFDWGHVDLIRRRWPGPLVLKGLLSPDDVRIAGEHGVDGIVVSNHGGRQLDGSVASIDVLAACKASAGSMTVLLDSGVRRGGDVLKSLALGADGVMVGRPILFSAILGGEEGIAHAITILRREIDIDLGLLGLRSSGEVERAILAR
jgi:L-lactate dehydrogenase (cytochrome)